MSARRAIFGPGLPPSMIATTPWPAMIFGCKPSARRCPATLAEVRSSRLDSSGWAWKSRRQATIFASSFVAAAATSARCVFASCACAAKGAASKASIRGVARMGKGIDRLRWVWPMLTRECAECAWLTIVRFAMAARDDRNGRLLCSHVPTEDSLQELGLQLLLMLFAAGLLAGFIDAIAGGGGMITIPAMLLAGIPPLQVLGTNKLQSLFGSGSASLAYARHGHVDLRGQLPMALTAALGAALGALLATVVPGDVLKAALPFLLLGIAVYFGFKPDAGEMDRHRR